MVPNSKELALNLTYFDEYEFGADNMLRSRSKSLVLPKEKLEYYKNNFVKLVRNV